MNGPYTSRAVRLTRARTALLLDHPFFGALLLRLRLTECAGIETMATDGVALFYNPSFLDGLSDRELVGVLAHEVMHPAMQHHTRRGERKPDLWNIACDHAINPILIGAQLALPEGALNDPRFAGMNAERIYSLLDRDQENQSGSAPNGPSPQTDTASGASESTQASGSGFAPTVPATPGGFGQVLDAPNPDHPGAAATDGQRSIQSQEWRIAVEQAQRTALAAGKIPAGMKRMVEQVRHAPVDWREALRRFFSQTVPQDYRWTPPNRRFVWAGLYLPGLHREGMGEIAIGVDCSGSISDKLLSRFSAEVNAIAAETRPEMVRVLYCDAAIQRVDEFAAGEQIELNPAGGGGTDFRPVFTYLEEHQIEPRCLIFLTDLAGSFPDDIPSYPVIWAATSERTAPFGETVAIDSEI